MSRSWGTVWVLVAVAVAMLLGWARPFRPGLRSEGTNVVLVWAVATRAEELTPYGGHPDATPGFAAAAGRGVRFTDVVSAGTGEPLVLDGYAKFEASALDPVFAFDGGPAGGPAIDHVLAGVGDHPAGVPIFVEVVLADASARPVPGFLARRFSDDTGLGAYRARLSRLDEAVSRLAIGLEALGYQDQNTVFAVVGLDEQGAAVPWLLWGAGVRRGHVVEGPAATVDVVPTLLGILGRGPVSGGADWSVPVGEVAAHPSTGDDRG